MGTPTKYVALHSVTKTLVEAAHSLAHQYGHTPVFCSDTGRLECEGCKTAHQMCGNLLQEVQTSQDGFSRLVSRLNRAITRGLNERGREVRAIQRVMAKKRQEFKKLDQTIRLIKDGCSTGDLDRKVLSKWLKELKSYHKPING